ncbi:hypothetical protein [Cellulophaga sp. Hel_I_12]|uniref:hypothetical protein n=1 Tax=Cellulophaga sp. Hel_I_12 TaxID=1249972 RepID=UPI0006482593|nr:hypothetical protein [Cellulophaga sp. Hel_I_12]
MKKIELEKYYHLKSKKRLSNNEFFELSKLSFLKRQHDFEKMIIPNFENFAKKFDFELTHSFKELSRIVLKKEGLEIFFVEEYQPRAIYNINFKFSIDDKEINYNLSNIVFENEDNLQLELNCFKEIDLVKALLFIEKKIKNNLTPINVKTILDQFEEKI